MNNRRRVTVRRTRASAKSVDNSPILNHPGTNKLTDLEKVASKLINSLHVDNPLANVANSKEGASAELLKQNLIALNSSQAISGGTSSSKGTDTSEVRVLQSLKGNNALNNPEKVKRDNSPSVFTEMASRKEQEKNEMRDRILQLEQQLKKQEEEQEDEEYRQLKERMRELERKLSTSTPQSPKKTKLLSRKNKGTEQINVDLANLQKGDVPSLAQIEQLLNISDKKERTRKTKPKRKRRSRRESSSSDETEDSSDDDHSVSSDSSESSSDDEEQRKRRKNKKGRNNKSGFYAKKGTTKIISNQQFAHTALEDEVGEDRDLLSLSFNLFVAGELEIITARGTSDKEKKTRLEILKKLAYKHEHLPREEVLNLIMHRALSKTVR